MSSNGAPIAWPDKVRVSRRDGDPLDEELSILTGSSFAMDEVGYMQRLGLNAKLNGVSVPEQQILINNAAVHAIHGLPQGGIARLDRKVLKPVISAALERANSIGIQKPNTLLDGSMTPGALQVPDLPTANGNYANVRSQGYPAIEDEDDYIRSLGLGSQPYQPFAWLFVGKVDFIDTLARYRNPFKTTLLNALEGTLQEGIMGTLVKTKKEPSAFSRWWNEKI